MTMLRIASFDIGRKNFAQYVEDWTVGESGDDPSPRKSIGSIDDVYLSGKRVQTGVYDLGSEEDGSSKGGLTHSIRLNLLKHLNSFSRLWSSCDVFIIEQQFFKVWSGRGRKKGSEANVDAIKIAEAVYMWFLDRYPFKTIEYCSSANKTKLLNAPKRMNKPQRKEWSCQEAERLYALRGDEEMKRVYQLRRDIARKRLTPKFVKETLKPFLGCGVEELARYIVTTRQKLDDISDACLQAQAYKLSICTRSTRRAKK